MSSALDLLKIKLVIKMAKGNNTDQTKALKDQIAQLQSNNNALGSKMKRFEDLEKESTDNKVKIDNLEKRVKISESASEIFQKENTRLKDAKSESERLVGENRQIKEALDKANKANEILEKVAGKITGEFPVLPKLIQGVCINPQLVSEYQIDADERLEVYEIKRKTGGETLLKLEVKYVKGKAMPPRYF